MALKDIFHTSASLSQAVEPGIKALVASNLDKLVNEVIEEAQKEVAEKIRNEFSSALEITLTQALNQSIQGAEISVTVDLRNNGQALK